MNLVIDLGSSQFRAAVIGNEEFICEPNVVANDKSGRFIIGSEAEQMIGRNPDVIQVWHPIQNGIVRDLDATVEVVKHAVNQIRKGRLKTRYKLTVAVPTGLSQVEKRALHQAGRQAGAHEVQLFESSIAAALGAGLPIDTPTGCLIVNLGAGVTEVSLLSMGGVVESRSIRKGGLNIDESILEQIRKRHHFAIGLRSAEQLKLQFESGREQTHYEVRGKSLTTGLPDTLVISRSLIEDLVIGHYQMVVNLIVETIEACPPELVGDIMDRGILLVGGAANAASVLSLTSQTHVPVVVAEEPENTTIRGLMRTQQAGSKRLKVDQFLRNPSFNLNWLTKR
ncbi:MAG: rod shape-determining protein MreB [Bacilli bacterium]|nr:rod shape-determining protein MreB [Bacilli bacterium]